MKTTVAPQVGIVNYGMGNLRSVINAIAAVGGRAALVERPDELGAATHLVLPGVGAFGEAMERLRSRGFIEPLRDAVLGRGTPFLGICLGMQLLATTGFEHGEHAGLGWIPGTVQAIPATEQVRVPHMGWNTLEVLRESPLLRSVPHDATFYFVHSYHFVPAVEDVVVAGTEHGGRLAAVIGRGHVFGTQFHPEKSQKSGLALLRNFLCLGAAPC